MAAENDNAKSQEDQASFNQEQYNVLIRCSGQQSMEEWNAYRRTHPGIAVRLRNADLGGASLAGGYFAGADLTEAKLGRANLMGANLSGANLRAASLFEARLTNANLGGANLVEANLTEAILRMASLIEAQLVHANLGGTDLTAANLGRADLTKADLRGANLSGANLALADLRGAKLGGASFTGAYLSGAKGVEATASRYVVNSSATSVVPVGTPLGSAELVELVINLADDITYEEVASLLGALRGLSLGVTGTVPHLNEIQIGQHTEEHAAWEGGNRDGQ